MLTLCERYSPRKSYYGELEFIIKDRNGVVLAHYREPNRIKIGAKEILSHRLVPDNIWDPNAASGVGDWVSHSIDIGEYAPKYFVFGASFDDDHNPLDTADTRFYVPDSVSGGYVPITLGVGAEYDGGLINAIPISEPTRPLKKVERVFFESSYQPAGTPLLEADVRAMNNVVVFETTLRKDEYNGFGTSASDYFTITEVALVAAAETGTEVGACECDPRDIFLTGSSDGDPFVASASGSTTISLDSGESEVDAIREGDQIKIVQVSSTAPDDAILNQTNPYYLVISKAEGGRDITLDRTPVDENNMELVGSIGILRDGFRIFSHRVLKSPLRKGDAFEIVCRWVIILD